MGKVRLQFPKNFLWGAASSAYQTEGNNTNSDWWTWEHSVRRMDALRRAGKNPEDYFGGIADDFWNRYDEDFALAQHLYHNTTRFGLEWSRIEPTEGVFDEKALDHYEKILQSAKYHGLKIFLTLHHYSNPIWFAKKGGFLNPQSVEIFKRFTEVVAKRLGEYVDFWLTINEPEVYSSHSYYFNKYPPQHRSLWETYKVVNNLVGAHRAAYEILKLHSGKPVSIAYQMADWQPTSRLSYITHALVEYLANGYILNRTVDYCDYIGLNYYIHHHVGIFGIRKHSHTNHELTDVGWGIHPEGIKSILLKLKKHHKPIYITENGIADAKDTKREKYIKDHLSNVHEAISQGADVRGYLYWSLTDNFEWAEGYGPRFGLIEIDREDLLRRRVRHSALAYAEICKNNFMEYEIV